jgi:uncharacterized membrane protein
MKSIEGRLERARRALVDRLRSDLGVGRVPDEVLADRVRQKLDRYVADPDSIRIDVYKGRVVLHGSALAEETEDLLCAVAAISGVHHVENELEALRLPGAPALVPQQPVRSSELMDVRHESWAPAWKLTAGAVCGGIAFLALRGRGVLAAAVASLAACLLVDRLTARHRFDMGGHRVIDFQKTLTVDATADEVYAFWSRLENFPRIMSHIHDVRDLGGRRSRWTAIGPLGITMSWNAIETARVPGQLLAWRSESRSPIENVGIVRFEPLPEGGTRMDVRLSYHPPRASLGDAVAILFGVDPTDAMEEDLARFESLIDAERRGLRRRAETRP